MKGAKLTIEPTAWQVALAVMLVLILGWGTISLLNKLLDKTVEKALQSQCLVKKEETDQ